MWQRVDVSFAKKLSFILLCVVFFTELTIANDGVSQVQNEIIDEKKLLKQAEKFTRNGEFTKAQEILKKILKLNNNNVKAKLQLSLIYLKERKYLESYDISYEIAKNDAKNSRAFALLGGAYLGTGNFRDASLCFQNAVVLDKDEALAYAGMGLLLFYENRIQESLNLLNDAVFIEPNDPDYLFTLALVSARAEQYKLAAESYRKFLLIAPDSEVERKARIRGLIGFLEYLGNKSTLYKIDGVDKTEVPIEIKRDRPIINVKVKETENLNFVLDTGSGITVISEETAKRLKIKPISRGGYARAVGGNGKFEIVYGFLKSITIGKTRIDNVPVYIRKFHEDNSVSDGYIGISLISKFLTTLDYQNKLFTLEKQKKSEVILESDKQFFMPLRLTSSGFLSGEVQLQGVDSPLNFIVDTGASISVISDGVANTNEISKHITDEKMRVIGAAGVTEDVPSFLLPSLSFGHHKREKIRAIALNLESINENSGFEQAGILGGNFLKNYRLTFDFVNSKVKFEPYSAKK